MSGSRTFTLVLAGAAYTLHRLKLGQIEDLGLLEIQKMPEVQAISRTLDALHLALQVAHPAITRKEVAHLVEIDDMALILPAVLSAAGFEQVKAELGNVLGLTLPGAGQPSTPT